jgi:hypothetical protein
MSPVSEMLSNAGLPLSSMYPLQQRRALSKRAVLDKMPMRQEEDYCLTPLTPLSQILQTRKGEKYARFPHEKPYAT